MRSSWRACRRHRYILDATRRQDTFIYARGHLQPRPAARRDLALLRPLPLPSESQEIREVAVVDHRGENWSREWFLRGRALRNPASRYLLSRVSDDAFFRARCPPDYALIRRPSGSRIVPRDHYRGGVAKPGSRRGGCADYR